MNRWHPSISIDDAAEAIGRESMQARRRAFGADQLERDLESTRDTMEVEAYDRPCEDCGQAMRLHGFEPRPMPGFPAAGVAHCPEPIPAGDDEGRDE